MINSRMIARLACLRASYSFQQKKNVAAIADLAAVLKLAHHIGSRGPFIATLVQFAIEHSVIDVAAAFLPQQDANTLKKLEASFQIPPQADPLRQGMLGEKQFLLQHIRPQYEKKNTKEAMQLLRNAWPVRSLGVLGDLVWTLSAGDGRAESDRGGEGRWLERSRGHRSRQH